MADSPKPNRFRRFVRRWLLFLGGGYILVVIIMMFLENTLVYKLETAADHWEDPPDPAIEELNFPSTDGTTIHGWYLPQQDSTSAMLLCHGNGGNISYRGKSLLRFREHLGCSVLIFDYPGYGKSTGKPTEEGCYKSGEAAIKWLKEKKGIQAENVILYGESLGGGVAIELAKRAPCKAVVLLKTFTSLPDTAQRMYRWLPVRWLMRNRFDSLSKIRNIHRPIFISSDRNDQLVPFEMGERLFETANEPKEFFPLNGEGHGDRVPDEFMHALRRFIDFHSAKELP